MKKAIQINLASQHFYIDEDAYEILSNYLNSIRNLFKKEVDEGVEIIEDIEARMAELFNSKLSGGKQVISKKEVEEVIGILGKVEDFLYEEETASDREPNDSQKDHYRRKRTRQLYRDEDNSMIAGICGGLGAYFNLDPVWFRIAFVISIFGGGIGFIIYLLLWFVVPKAVTTAQKLEMRGEPVNVENIKKTVTEEYERVKKNLNNLRDSDNMQRIKNVFTDILHAIGSFIAGILKFAGGFIGVALIIAGIFILLGMIFGGFSFHHWNFHWGHFPYHFPFIHNSKVQSLFSLCLLFLIIIPIVALIYGGIKLMFNIKTRNSFIGVPFVTVWIISLITAIGILATEKHSIDFESKKISKTELSLDKYKTAYIKLDIDNEFYDEHTVSSMFGYKYYYHDYSDEISVKPELDIRKSSDEKFHLIIEKRLLFTSGSSGEHFNDVEYDWYQADSIISFNNFFTIEEEDKWRFPEMKITLKVPQNAVVYFMQEIDDILDKISCAGHCWKRDLINKRWVMTERGLEETGK